jgi:hypothetical protein
MSVQALVATHALTRTNLGDSDMRLGKSFSFAVAMLASGTAFAGTPGWSISESSGQVSVVSTGLVKAAVRGGAVATGDIINTGRNGRAVLVRGEEYLVVSPNTRLRVADPAKTGGLTQIVEHFGNVIYKIKKMTMPHFAVETPFLAAVVKGTTFSVTVTEKGAAVQVIEGRVEVATRDGGASFMVLPGDIGSVSARAPATLNVQGRENRSISSPTPAAAAAAVTESVEADAPVASPATPEAPAEQAQFSGSVEKPVTEGAVNLSAMSDGMVSGDSSMTAMAAMSSAPVREAQTQAAAPAQPAIVEPVLVAAADPAPTPLPVTNTVIVVEPTALPPAPVDTVDALPPPPAPAVDPVSVPPVGDAVDAVPAPLPPTPAPVADPLPVPPAGGAADPVPVPLPPTPVIAANDPTPAGPAIVEPVQVVTVAPTPAPSVSNNGNGNGNNNGGGNGNGNGLSNNIGNNGSGNSGGNGNSGPGNVNGLNGNSNNSNQNNNGNNSWNSQVKGGSND